MPGAMKKETLTVAQLRHALEEGVGPPVVVLLGAESMLRRRALKALREPFVRDDDVGAVDRLDGAEVSLREILDEARSLPLFAMGDSEGGPCRLVHVVEFDRVDADETSELERYLEDPVTETRLVLEATKLDKRKAVYKLLARTAVLVDCDPVERESDVRRWIEVTVRDNGYEIEREALVVLTEMAGTSLTTLEQELEKVMLYVGESGTIRARDLEGLLGRSRERSIFELTDSLVAADGRRAQEVLNILLDDGEEPLRILAMVAWILRQLVTAEDLASRGLARKKILGQLGGRYDQRGRILQRARRCSRRDLLEALAACGDADLSVKRLRDKRSGGDKLRPARGRLEALCRQICAA